MSRTSSSWLACRRSGAIAAVSPARDAAGGDPPLRTRRDLQRERLGGVAGLGHRGWRHARHDLLRWLFQLETEAAGFESPPSQGGALFLLFLIKIFPNHAQSYFIFICCLSGREFELSICWIEYIPILSRVSRDKQDLIRDDGLNS